jgi:hypothetical protein
MGSVGAALIFEVPTDGRVELALAKDGEGDAVGRHARGLANGPLVLQLGAHRRALVDAAASRDIDVVIVVEPAGDAVVARALVGAGKGSTQRRATVEAAVAAALATVADDGTLRGGTAPVVVTDAPPPKQRKPIVRAWWLWTSVAVVVATGLGLGLGLGLKDRKSDRVVIFGPD